MSDGTAATQTEKQGIERRLASIQKLIGRKQLSEADVQVSELCAAFPEHVESLYTKAVVKRLRNRTGEAAAVLEQLLKLAPEHSRAYQELGHLHIASKSLALAIEAFEKAVSLDSALIASWNALVGLHKMDGNKVAARRAEVYFSRLKVLPAELVGVSTLINEKRYATAESICRKYLQRHPRDVEAMRLLAKIGLELGVAEDAEFLLIKALEFRPDYHLARFDYTDVLLKRRKYQTAFEQAQKLMQAAPNDHNFLRLYANTCMNVGRQAEALNVYNEVLKVDPDNPQILLLCGHAAKTAGNVKAGIEYYKRCYTSRPNYGDAFWSLANLKTYALDEREVELATRHEAAATTASTDRIHLCFALGKAHEDRGDFDRSFEYYRRGNRLRRQELAYRPELITTEVDEQIDVFTPSLVSRTAGFGHRAADPIFIVGLPRSGSTLIEQILASHSDVDGTFELPNILNMVRRLKRQTAGGHSEHYPYNLQKLSQGELESMGKQYVDETRIHRGSGRYFTDKMPNNFRHIGLILMMLPNAKIIDSRRSPMPCCFSGYKQLFAEGQAFSYGLRDIGMYYRDYIRLMNHWNEVFPGKILSVQYEEVVKDFPAQVERILDYCNLDMQQQCLEFHKTKRPVSTPSSEQVRQPIFQQGLEQWRHFETHLQPLRSILGTLAED